MKQPVLFETIPCDKLQILDKDELVTLTGIHLDIIRQLQDEVKRLANFADKTGEQTLLLNGQYIVLKEKIFGRSSEKSKGKKISKKMNKDRKKRVLLPSERYPNIPLKDQEIVFKYAPNCFCCGKSMRDMGLTEDSEHLTVVPAKYEIIRQRRHKYSCGYCHGLILTAPVPPRIKPGSSYSDEILIDASMSKYCDLIPMERYAAIAERAGLPGLPPHSLIEGSHYLADFTKDAYERLKAETCEAWELKADETPHRLLELNKKGYLWGFSTDKACYFEIHSTRAGEVASGFLKESKCRFLLTDAYSGYAKAVREANEYRKEKGFPLIKNIYCNAHCRRRFSEASLVFKDEAKFFIRCYEKIYRLENKNLEDKSFPLTKIRKWQKIYFRLMKRKALNLELNFSTKSLMGKAMNYLLKNYKELTLFMEHNLSIENNGQERLLRNPVIGRKTWYGTQSIRGARTASILFSLVESCKLNKVNPREYFKELVSDLHQGKACFTPAEFKLRLSQDG